MKQLFTWIKTSSHTRSWLPLLGLLGCLMAQPALATLLAESSRGAMTQKEAKGLASAPEADVPTYASADFTLMSQSVFINDPVSLMIANIKDQFGNDFHPTSISYTFDKASGIFNAVDVQQPAPYTLIWSYSTPGSYTVTIYIDNIKAFEQELSVGYIPTYNSAQIALSSTVVTPGNAVTLTIDDVKDQYNNSYQPSSIEVRVFKDNIQESSYNLTVIQAPYSVSLAPASAGVRSIDVYIDNSIRQQLSLDVTCPTITAELVGTATICAGGSNSLAVNISEPSGSYTVVYSPDGGQTQVTLTDYTSGESIWVSPVTSTTYTLVSVSNAGVCDITESGTATTTLTPTAVSIPDVAQSGILGCLPATVTLTASSSGATSYSIAPATSTGAVGVFYIDSPAIYTITAGNGLAGCSQFTTITVSSETATPGVSLAASNNGVLTCTMPVLTLSASSTTAAVSFSFAGPAITSTAPTAISLNGQGTYSVTATNPVNGCISSTTASIISTTETPGVSLTATNGGVIACGVETVTLTADSPTSGVSYSFAGNNNFTRIGNSIETNAADTYSVTAVDPNTGCFSVGSLEVGLNLVAPSFIQVSQAGTIGCGPNSVTITALANGATSYSLSPGGQSDSAGQFVVTGATTYTITASNGEGAACQSQTTVVVSQATNAVAGTIAVSGVPSCGTPARLIASVTGSSSVFTGPDGYVFSNVYRNAGAYTIFAEGIKTGGTYTLTVSNGADCPATINTVVVQGPASCP